MKHLTDTPKTVLRINLAFMSVIFILNYFYQKNGFDFTLKCICSIGFAAMGLLNLCYAFFTGQPGKRFYLAMTAGLILAMHGDILINTDFLSGAAAFALGHICFAAAYCFLQRPGWGAVVIGSVFGIGSEIFLLCCPLLIFHRPVLKIICMIYALIISAMTGMAAVNFIQKRTVVFGMIAAGSLLFFVSDLMLVLDCFIRRWQWTDEACMGTYYPALCILAFSMFWKAAEDN